MKVEVVQATNWLSHVDSELAPNGAGFLTIRGEHGVGKTALVEAIDYALFGRGRFDTADEPVRLGATDMSVRVEWISPDGPRYRVVRRRTTKSGGKGSLNFAIAASDDTWTSLDGSSIRDTEARIREVVGVDGPTFEAIAFLMQGRITALVEASAAGRRDVLVGGLLLEIWTRAGSRARKRANELEASLVAERAQLVRIEEQLEGLPELEAELASAAAQLTKAEAAVTKSAAERDRLAERIRELDASLAEAVRLEADVARLEADRSTIAEGWRRARDRADAARAQITRLEELLAGVDELRAAVAALPAARALVEELVQRESADRRLREQLADMDRAIRDLEIPHSHAVATWQAQHDAAAARVAELEAHAAAGTSVCEACGQAIEPKAGLEQLKLARAARKALGERPQEPVAAAAARAQRFRVEQRAKELAWDPAAMVASREELTRLERLAARADDLVRMEGQLVRETATATEADAEKAQLAERGHAITAELAGVQARIAEAGPFREERRAAGDALGRAVAELELAQGSVRQLERAIAGAEAQVAQLRAQEAEAARIRDAIAAGSIDEARDRRLAAAFGEIPLRLIDASLPELEHEAQTILDQLEPGSMIEISAQRATVDGKRIVSAIDILFTDAAGRRDVRMTSGGERVAVSVALSLGLRRVLSRRHGARLETAAIDEPDGLDAAQRRALAVAIRGLVHSGDLARAWLITHHEDLAEAGDAQVVVSKNGSGSVLEQVA